MKAKPSLRFSGGDLDSYPETGKASNKAPEPTTFAVTSRAMVRFAEERARTVQLMAARAAPAKVVAHL
jgi:hypothetical protein